METPKVYVLLAAYNGQKYIRQMIDSVLMQDYENLQLILSDDGSQDDTRLILAEYARKNPDRVVHYQSGMKFGCAQYHFLHLLSKFCDAPYIMFCDQDDIWHRDKVRKTLLRMQKLEDGTDVPVMVHTDLRVVDEDLGVVDPSFWNYSNLDGSRLALNQLLVQNVATGCTMMINRSLAQLVCSSIPDSGILMHDWWIALVAAACGKAGVVSDSTMDYRQHGNNSVGAKDVRSLPYLWKRFNAQIRRRPLEDNAVQAQLLLQCHRDHMKTEQISVIRSFIEAQKSPWLLRNCLYIRHGFLKYGLIRKIAQFMGL